MPVTSNPSKLYGASLQNIVTPLTATQIANPEGSANSRAYIYIQAATSSYVQIDIGSSQPIYSTVITTRLDAVRYGLVGCYVQTWNDTKTTYWQSDNVPNHFSNFSVVPSYNGINSYWGYEQYIIYPPNTQVQPKGNTYTY